MTGRLHIEGHPGRLAERDSDRASLQEALRSITGAAHQVITGVNHSSVSVITVDGRFETLAATDPVVLRSDALQYEYGEGPCVLAARSGDDVVALDVGSDLRWPRYGPEAIRLGLVAQAALPLQLEARTWGALNLYSMNRGEMDEISLETGRLLASTAAIMLGLTRRVESLQTALESRSIIGQAIGITMATDHVDEGHAFAALVRTSQSSNTKLREVARRIVDATNRGRRQPERV